ncbi:porin [Reichenbachiella sp.]|uniref:porin n=1 Tax=Reichenbachiella sp. TaxID=2184521 RepID=UPI003297320B
MKKCLQILLTLVFCNMSNVVVAAFENDSTKEQSALHDVHHLATMKLSVTGQIWLRYTELNPGSLVDGLYQTSSTDLSIRRFRMAFSGDVTERVYAKIQIGLNNFNDLSKSSEIRLLDLLAVYKLYDQLYLGLGKNGYTGPSRYASVASGAMLGADIPIFALSTINISDDYLRKLSIFVKGDIGSFAYRLVLAKPNRIERSVDTQEETNFARGNTEWQPSGYFKYQFLDKEGLTSAYMPGTYHGTKRILNLGIGFLTQDKAMSRMFLADTHYYRMNQWAVDLFADFPLNHRNSQSVTFYGAYFNTDFGPDYVRMIGANNPSIESDGSVYNGAGNMYPSIGTGKVYYCQIGYRFALPERFEHVRALQPYFHIQYADYERLNEPMKLYDIGINLLFNGHRSKLTFGWQGRPVYEGIDHINVTNRKNMYVMQYQFKL